MKSVERLTSKETYALTVFIVDDSPLIVGRLTGLINDLDNVAVIGDAGNIPLAIKLIEAQRPDAVILDIHLEHDAPYATGIDLLTTLRKMYPAMIIMMVTNLSEPQYQHKCTELGADYFFDKSTDFDEVLETIKSIAK